MGQLVQQERWGTAAMAPLLLLLLAPPRLQGWWLCNDGPGPCCQAASVGDGQHCSHLLLCYGRLPT